MLGNESQVAREARGIGSLELLQAAQRNPPPIRNTQASINTLPHLLAAAQSPKISNSTSFNGEH